MAKFNYIQGNFAAGQLSRRFDGRTDLKQYNNGCRKMVNAYPTVQGGARKRLGTKFVADITPFASSSGKMIPYSRSTSISRHAVVIDPDGATDADRFRMYDTLSGFQPFSGIAFVPTANGPTDLIPSGANPYVIQYTQIGDVLIICSPEFEPVVLRPDPQGGLGYILATWTSYTSNPRSNTGVDFLLAGIAGLHVPYLDNNTNGNFLMKLTDAGGGHVIGTDIWIDWEDAGATPLDMANLPPSDSPISYPQPGTFIKATISSATGIYRVKSKVSATRLLVTPTKLAGAINTLTDNWELQAWSSKFGWPSTVAFHDGRVIFGASKFQPEMMWASSSENLAFLDGASLFTASTDRTLTAAHPLKEQLAGGKVQPISWINSSNGLLVGTGGDVFVAAGANGGPLVATELNSLTRVSGEGSFFPQPTQVGETTLFVGNKRNNLKSITLSDGNSRRFDTSELTILADDIIVAPNFIVDTDVDIDKSMALLVHSDYNVGASSLAVAKWNNVTKESGWCSFEIGGTDVEVFSVAAFQSTFNNSTVNPSQTMVLVKRTINSVTKVYLESINEELGRVAGFNDDEYYYSDSWIQKTPSGTSVTGLGHLEGETVKVLVDGKVQADKTVSGGAITLDATGTIAIIGLSYAFDVETMRLQAGQELESSDGQMDRVDRLNIKMYETPSLKIGEAAGPLTPVVFEANDGLFTGEKLEFFDGGQDRGTIIRFYSDDPTPVEVVSYTARGVKYE